MARARRLHYPGCFYHVMLKGNHAQDIFFSDNDRYKMCFLLQEGVERYGHRIHAFCFMRNHIHLLIQVGEISLSRIMQNLAFRYSQKINHSQKMKGHLFHGRFKAILIQDEQYFTKLLRYIHRNPVRAGITELPEDYVWSSHNAYLNRQKIAWVTSEYGLYKFAKNKAAAILDYSAYVLELESHSDLSELRKNFKDGQVLGDAEFFDSVRNSVVNQKVLPLPIEAIIKVVCEEFNIESADIKSDGKSHKASLARAFISFIATDVAKIPIVTLATKMNRDSSTISALLSRFNAKRKNSIDLQADIAKLKKKVFEIARCNV